MTGSRTGELLHRTARAVPVAGRDGGERRLQAEEMVRGVAAVAEQHAVGRVCLAAAPTLLFRREVRHRCVGGHLQDPVLVQTIKDGYEINTSVSLTSPVNNISHGKKRLLTSQAVRAFGDLGVEAVEREAVGPHQIDIEGQLVKAPVVIPSLQTHLDGAQIHRVLDELRVPWHSVHIHWSGERQRQLMPE